MFGAAITYINYCFVEDSAYFGQLLDAGHHVWSSLVYSASIIDHTCSHHIFGFRWRRKKKIQKNC